MSSSPEATSESTDSMHEEVIEFQTASHGGPRNCKAYGDKLLCLETHNIRSFVNEKRCYCGCNCLGKLSLQGEEAERTVHDIRAARFASK